MKEGCEIYKGRNHNLIMDNCHSHVAKCLNIMAYSKYILMFFHVFTLIKFLLTYLDRHSTYDMIKIGVWMFFYGKFVNPWAFVRSYLPFAIIVAVIALMSGLLG